jgi:3-oxoacyl-[acyl-carrier-protein] synthase-1
MTKKRSYLNALGMLCSLGKTTDEVQHGLQSSHSAVTLLDEYGLGYALPIGTYSGALPEIPLFDNQWQTRNNQFAYAAYLQIQADINQAIDRYGAHRVAVIIGTSTSGISESEEAIAHWVKTGSVSETYDYKAQEMGATAQFIAKVTGVSGPVYGISTACSSGSKALASARRLIRAGLCDAVIAGGVDTLCKLTVQGFSSLEAVSRETCLPFSANRKGINIGEGAGLFLVSAEARGVELKGVGESSDAHHISAPDPSGAGAIRCMQAALDDAGVPASEIGYVNLHGTATALNDQMEAKAMFEVCGSEVYCSSTKPYTGHTLGAAGAIEAAICWLLLQEHESGKEQDPWLPVHLWDGQADPELPELLFVSSENQPNQAINYALSNSFAFGGNNIAVLLGRINEL